MLAYLDGLLPIKSHDPIDPIAKYTFEFLDSNLENVGQIYQDFQKAVEHCKNGTARGSVVSTNAHIGLIVSLKPSLNLRSLRLLNCSLRCVRSFTPSGS